MAAIYPTPSAPVHLRLAAWLLDNLIFLPFTIAPLVLLDPDIRQAQVLAFMMTMQSVYYILPMAIFHTTPAKRLLNMRITKEDGSPLEPDGAVLRYLVFFLTTWIPFGLLASGALLFLDPERRTFHDRLARTTVVLGYNRF